MAPSQHRIAVVAVLLLSVIASAAAAKSSADERRLAELQQLSESNYGLISLDDNKFTRYATAKTRSYHLFVMLTARRQLQCSLCRDLENEFALLAASYVEQSAEGKFGDKLPVFFAEANYDSTRGAFATLNVKTIPYVFHFEASSKYKPAMKAAELMGSKHMFASDNIVAEDLSRFVRGHVGIDIEIVRPAWPRLVMLLAIVAALVFAVRFFSSEMLAIAIYLRDNKQLWFVLCVGIYFVAVSGIVYDIIRQPPMGLFTPAANQQFVIEGLFMGGLNVACGGLAIGLIFYVPKLGDDTVRVPALVTILVAFSFLYTIVVMAYKIKSPWYSLW